MDLVLGIDGGGTKTAAWLGRVDDAGGPLGRGLAGPSNPRAVGLARSLEALEAAIDGAFAVAGLERQTVAALSLALAGSDRDVDRRPLLEWAAEKRVALQVRVVPDAEPLLWGATDEGWGLALIAGTGSLAYGRAADGRTARAGGWGYLFGDEGSGYAIALAGLRAVALAADGRGPATALTAPFLQRLACRQPADLIAAVYRDDVDRAVIASWADIVLDHPGDSAAQGILFQAAGDLAGMLEAVVRALKLEEQSCPVALAGGLLIHSETLRGYVGAAAQRAGLVLGPVVRVAEPAAGALRHARHLAANPS